MVNEIVSLISLYNLFLLVYSNESFLCINFISYNFTKFIDSFLQFSGSIFRIFYV